MNNKFVQGAGETDWFVMINYDNKGTLCIPMVKDDKSDSERENYDKK